MNPQQLINAVKAVQTNNRKGQLRKEKEQRILDKAITSK